MGFSFESGALVVDDDGFTVFHTERPSAGFGAWHRARANARIG